MEIPTASITLYTVSEMIQGRLVDILLFRSRITVKKHTMGTVIDDDKESYAENGILEINRQYERKKQNKVS